MPRRPYTGCPALPGAAQGADAKLGVDLGGRHQAAWVRSAIVADIALDGARATTFASMVRRRGRRSQAAGWSWQKVWVAGDLEARLAAKRGGEHEPD